MPWYKELDRKKNSDRRTAAGLLRLRAALDDAIPPRTASSTMLLATWNIREFDSGKYGDRTDEPIYYMAEIIDRFDVVAVQEVRDDLRAFNRLMKILGSEWRFLLTDVTEGRQGNRERVAFLYNGDKVRFGGLAGEVVLPSRPASAGPPVVQLVRTPYIVGFGVDWLKFAICTTHILYGSGAPELPERIAEIESLVAFLVNRAQSAYPDARNTILLGDFNVFDTSHATLTAITDQGFAIPEAVLAERTNVARDKHYDQVAILGKDLDPAAIRSLRAGAFPFFEHVYRDDEEGEYASAMGTAYRTKKDGSARDSAEKRRYYRDWRTHQMSDHLPLWVEIPTDLSTSYLTMLATPPTTRPRRRPQRTESERALGVEDASPAPPPPQ